MKAALIAMGFLLLTGHPVLGGTLPLEGDYNCTGTNPNGSVYRGTTTITRISQDTYSLKWSIGPQTFTGTGALAKNTLTVDWGDKWPVIYKVNVDGTLEGTWSNGRATEILVPRMRAGIQTRQQAPATASRPASPPSKEAIREAQELLATLGYAPGPADGMWGQRSARAYKAFLKDAGLPAAEDLSADGLRAMRDKAESKAAATSTQPGTETPQASASPPTRSTGEVIAAVTELAIQAMHAYTLIKLMEDPENIARVAPELLELLEKILSGHSAADLSDRENAQISLGALTVAERGRLSDLLKEDQGLPNEARDALSDALRAKAAAPAVALEPKCAGAAKGTSCWMEVANKPGCHIWINRYRPDPAITVTWSGTCPGGAAEGHGTLEWAGRTKGTFNDTGTLSNGKRYGRWVVHRRYSSGIRKYFKESEGPYEDGKRHGRWVLRRRASVEGDHSFVNQDEGPYEDGKRHGRWVLREHYSSTDAKIVTEEEGRYEDGKRHGRWVEHKRSSGKDREVVTKTEGRYENGKQHGKWVERSSDGSFEELPYVHGKRHGRGVRRDSKGVVFETTYVDGDSIEFVIRRLDGSVTGPVRYKR